MADDDAPLPLFAEIGSKPKAHGLDAEQADLFAEQPAGIVFAKARGLYQRRRLVGGGVGDNVRARPGKHAVGLGMLIFFDSVS